MSDAVHDPVPVTPLVAEEAAKEETNLRSRCRHKRCPIPGAEPLPEVKPLGPNASS